MLFALIHHTEDWRVEGSLTLDVPPCVGDIVICNDDESERFDDEMFVVDRIIRGEKYNYLLVSPYLDYGEPPVQPEQADPTETLAECIKRLSEQVGNLERRLTEQNKELQKLLNGLCNDLAEINASGMGLQESVDKISERLHPYD